MLIIVKNVVSKRNFFPTIAESIFMTSKPELDFWYNRLCVPVASRVAERRKTLDLQKLGNISKISKSVGGRATCPVSLTEITLCS